MHYSKIRTDLYMHTSYITLRYRAYAVVQSIKGRPCWRTTSRNNAYATIVVWATIVAYAAAGLSLHRRWWKFTMETMAKSGFLLDYQGSVRNVEDKKRYSEELALIDGEDL